MSFSRDRGSRCVLACSAMLLAFAACASPDKEFARAPETEAQATDEATAAESVDANLDAASGPARNERWDADFEAADKGGFAPPPPGDHRREGPNQRDWFDREQDGNAVAWKSPDDALAELGALEQRLAMVGVPMPAFAAGLTGDAPVGGAYGDETTRQAGSTDDLAAPKPATRPGTGGAKKPTAKRRKANKQKKNKTTSTRGSTSTATPAPPTEDGVRGDEPVAEENEAAWCQDVCRLTAAICSLERRICDMAVRTPEDQRYAAACERAANDCRVATAACQDCSG